MAKVRTARKPKPKFDKAKYDALVKTAKETQEQLEALRKKAKVRDVLSPVDVTVTLRITPHKTKYKDDGYNSYRGTVSLVNPSKMAKELANLWGLLDEPDICDSGLATVYGDAFWSAYEAGLFDN